MPNLGGGELIFILVIVLIVFGAGRLPDVLGQLGKGVKSFRDEAQNTDSPKIDSAKSSATSKEEPKKSN